MSRGWDLPSWRGAVSFGQGEGDNLWSSCCRFKRILVLISHSQDFLNGVCTNIIHLHNRKLKYYTVGKGGAADSCPAGSS